MPRIGITGHSNLSAEAVSLVADAVREVIRSEVGDRGLVGVTCLARGADQIFARVVLAEGGTVEVVLPAADYRDRRVKPDSIVEFDDLIRRASSVTTLPFSRSNSDAYMAASDEVLRTIDFLIAVWDGKPSTGYGGTADVVDTARERGLPVMIVWPPGARRE